MIPLQPFGYNLCTLACARTRYRFAVSGLLEHFPESFGRTRGVRMEHVLRNSLYAL